MAKKKIEKFSDDQYAFAPRVCNTGAQSRIAAPYKNECHLDWLEFTCSDSNVFLRRLGISPDSFLRLENGLHGYPCQLKREGISLLYDEYRPERGQKVIVSGAGFAHIPYSDADILDAVVEAGGTPQRIDICLNVYDGGFTMNDVENAIYSGELVTRFKTARPVKTYDLGESAWRPGVTIYLGSSSGSRKFRIYDKKAQFETENNVSLGFSWVRFELETRKRAAQALFRRLVSGSEGIRAIPGIIRSVCDFRSKKNVINKDEWDLLPWWAEVIKNVEIIRCGIKKVKKNLEEKAAWFEHAMRKTFAYIAGGKGENWVGSVLRSGALKLSDEEISEIQHYAGITFKPFREFFRIPSIVGRELVADYGRNSCPF